MSTATARIEVRLPPDAKARIENAADLEDTTVSNFITEAAMARADEVERHHMTHTTVPDGFFDDLLSWLDEPAERNPALAKAVKRSHARATKF